MGWPSPSELESLISRFHDRTLPKSDWTHHAHLAVGTWLVGTEGPERALVTLRRAIRLLNQAHGTANSDTGGYHETITHAYVILIEGFLRESGDEDLPARIQSLLRSPLASRAALLTFYSKARLFSVEARRAWVEPDLAPLALDRVFEPAAPHVTAR